MIAEMKKKSLEYDSNPATPQRRYSVDNALGASMSSITDSTTGRLPDQKGYLLACERGDIGSVRNYLAERDRNGIDMNGTDPLGRNALLIAIENENVEMVRLLLDNDIETADAILYAILEENVQAVEMIVEHLEKNEKFNPETQGVVIDERSAFTPDITPIILAAHKDNYELIKLFLDRKASIPHPHDVRCSCKECLQVKAEDTLCLSRSRINAYRALASPSLICLSAKDPILYAFELSWELRRLSYIENEFRSEYQELSQQCQLFSVKLLDQVRNSTELEIILNHTTNAWEEVTDRRSAHLSHQLARLKLAVKLRQKRFVAHPSCQQLLAAIWYEGLPGFRNRHILFKLLLILSVAVSFPLLSLVYLIAPKSCLGNLARKPFIKFLCHSASYIFFLFLLILASQRIDYNHLFGGAEHEALGEIDPDRKERRGPPPTPVEWAILAWVIGLIWVEIKQLWDCGLHEYCHNLWNILDFITNSLYMCTFALRTVAYYQVEAEMKDPRMQHIGRHLYRRDWDAWDPTLISECFFATANIFSSLKLVPIFTFNPHLGPLKISLGRMVIDILKFFLLYCLVLFAFACGLNQLFWYYASMRQQECDLFKSSPERYASMQESCDHKYRSFASLFNTLETLFWALFGLVDLNHFVLKEDHSLTEWTGKTIFGSYSCCAIVVLLNMLIAMMSNSYQYISNQADIEWKFARSKLWMEYFEDTATLPPPFNMVPSPKSFYYGMHWVVERFCHNWKKFQQGKQRSMRNQKILKIVNHRENQYRATTRLLIKRYIVQQQRNKQLSEGVSEDDVNEIKQDISAFRFELLDILRRAGYQTGHTDIKQRAYTRNKKRTAMIERRYNENSKSLPDAFNIPFPELLNNNVEEAPRKKSRAEEFLSQSLNKLTPGKVTPVTWSKFKRFSKRVNFRQPSIGGITGIGGVHFDPSVRRKSAAAFKSYSVDDADYFPCSSTSRRRESVQLANKAESCDPASLRRQRLMREQRQSEDTVLEMEAEDLVV
ncbi:hypothetical protein QR680_013369 [Steinernema hermaphroditum]|uniref:Transient receptor ion channel domain-containing protein n=1 Tax=Steinernema hermaphroditum TaxID=289476 RepID=A0AA39M2E3_9BILA|nr:hypothetical protein QR680_013369 [Steinernema hermaphroditum]